MPKFRFRPLLLLIPIIIATACMMLVYPSESLLAAERGVQIWWDILFPALFPFLVLSEMMLGFGIVHFFGTLLDPIMRPLFRIPGIGGFVVAMGFASGYPVGARLTAKLWEDRLVTREEGERLVAFTTSSDPIFLIGAVSVGFFGDVSLAPLLAVSHYGSALLLGVLMRFHGRGATPTPPAPPAKRSLLRRSFGAMHRARLADGRPLGLLLEQSIRTSIRLIFVIGGLVVFFSVVIEMLRIGQALGTLHAAAGAVLQLAGMPAPLSDSIVNGLFEVTLGAKSAGHAGVSIPLPAKVAAAAFVLSWAGLSVHAQVVSLLQQTNLRYAPFLFARLAHGILASAFVLALWEPMQQVRAQATAVLEAWAPVSATSVPFFNWLWTAPASLTVFSALLLALSVLAFGSSIWRSVHVWSRKPK